FGDEPLALGRPPRWNVDAHSGHAWPLAHHRRIDYRNSARQSDVKVAWELSRLRHCVALAQSVVVLGDEDALREIEIDVADWLRCNPLGWSVNWTCAMEVALRAVNLICVDAILTAGGRTLRNRAELVASLYQHGWFLARNLEISEVNGNHFLADAVGLVWLGRWFAGIGEASAWAARGAEMVREAAREQVLADGLDHEGSLRYHLLVLELFCSARAAGGAALSEIGPAIERMAVAASAIVGPGGRVPDIGDDDGGRALAFSDAPSSDGRRVIDLAAALLGGPLEFGDHPEDAIWLVGPQRRRVRSQTASRPQVLGAGGVVVLGDGGDHVVWDVGPIGFRGIGGHGHVDAMSFEAHLGGAIAVRDSGTGSYTGDPALRNELRDGPAHSIATIDGRAYAQIGGVDELWRISGDSPPVLLEAGADDDAQVASAVQRLPRDSEHRRLLRWRRGMLEVCDEISAPSGARVEVRLQVPEDCSADGAQYATARHAYRVEPPSRAAVELVACRASAGYGTVGAGRRIVVSWTSPGGSSGLRWLISTR
ncbi:MAG: heparinase II/III family protein, partial [Chloroflexota bacterium]|nr:heparinase II/III family protein [Chloroflexota bacterium]